jgi:hypothetical protein
MAGGARRAVAGKRLMFAVLLDAVIQLQGRNERDAAEAEAGPRRAEDSPFVPDDGEAPGIEPGYLAQGLLSWRERRTAAQVPVRAPRQLRTSHTHVTPRRWRRRRMAIARTFVRSRVHWRATSTLADVRDHRPHVAEATANGFAWRDRR